MILDGLLQVDPKETPVVTLLDSGADCNFISRRVVDILKIPTHTLDDPIPLRLADGNLTDAIDLISVPVRLLLGSMTDEIVFYVTDLNPFDLVLGHSWLYSHNPKIDWKNYKMKIANHEINGRAQGAHPLFRPVSSTIQSLDLYEGSMAEDVYPFMRPRSIDQTNKPTPSFVLEEFSDVFNDCDADALPPKDNSM